MTRPITTAPADTARAMHAAEMRGQDMQDTSEYVPELTMHYPVKPMPDGKLEILHYGGGPVAMFQPFTITEAECQRRIDAAVLAEREACAAVADASAENLEAQAKRFVSWSDPHYYRTNVAETHRQIAAAIRARKGDAP